MEEGGGLSEPGERPMISPRSDGCLPPAPPETGIREPSSPGQNPACMGKFGLWRSHSVAESKSISKIHSSAGEEPARPVWRGDRGGRFLGPRLSKRSQSKGITSDISTASGSREGRHFTVGNVGQNGKIYLRPVPISKQAFHTRGRSQPPGHGHTKHVKSLQPMPQSEDVRHSFWSNSQMSDLRPQHIQESSLGGRTVRDGMAGSYHHGSQLSRRHSLSTIGDEYHPSPSRNRGELRIVIERPDTEEFKPHGKVEVPSLEMSIPHYRLGGFRFTPGGTPMLRSSAYTRTSVSDNFRSSTFMRADDPEVPSIPSEIPSSGLSSYTPPLFPSPRALSGINTSPAQSSVFYKLKEPIDPSVFDHLMLIMDDVSVVRYAKETKQVTAATPARIVAQISSESFMDYELVSDFFLTFRSYLSPSNLLSLLLARLQWAINRLEDDGRIIRIRVFAALRHWILNYFVDDFVSNRDLRIQFCGRLNHMYEEIKHRSKNSHSDLKILIDLKKCWNGRCSLYWDAQESADRKDPDEPVVPGGIEGSNDGELSSRDLEEIGHNFENVLGMRVQPPVSARPFSPAAGNLDSRNQQASPEPVVERRTSPLSPSTIQPDSCSFPHIIPKRNSFQSNQAEAPHPVVLASPKFGSPISPGQFAFPPMPPIWRRPMHSHKRSGSFSDSVRDDRAPLPLSSVDSHGQPPFQMLPHTENMIRGNVYGPPEPLLVSFGPPSPNFEVPPTGFGRQDTTTRSDRPKQSGPAVKAFIGTLRRALQTRPSGQGPSRGISPSESRGKTSPLPKNVSFRPDGYRGKGGTHSQSNTRVDLLCEEAYLSYRKLLKESELSRPSMDQGTARSAPSDTQKERHLSGDMPANPNYLAASRRDSIPSQLTTGSKSIVIVDDTRTGTPIMPSRLQISLPPTRYDPSKPARSYSPSRDVGSKPFIPSGTIRHSPCYGESFTTMFGSKAPESGRESLVTCGESNRGVNKIFHNIRKYASHESVMNRHKPGSDIESVNRSDISQKSSLKPRGPTLRRRRGGDLRKMQNETESVPRSKASSAADDMTETSSMGGSMLQMANKIHFNERNKEAANRAHPRQRHSLDESRHLRRSFEATVAGFAKIPDDGDGGIESTLLKLEGKWETQSPICGQQGDSNARVDGSCKLRAPGASTLGSSEHGASSTSGVRISSYVESEDSYCSVPLLERGLADDSMKSPRLYDADSNTNSQPQLSGQEQLPSTETEPSLSIEMVEKTDSMQQLPHHSRYMKSRSTSAHPYGNELEIDDYASELSSEISIDVINGAEAAGPSNRNGHGASPIMAFATLGVPTHPLADPPSPPITLGYQGNRTSDVYPTSLQQQPLTPEVSPNSMALRRTSGGVKHIRSHPDNSQRNGETHLQGSPTGALTGPGHTPFILAYDSELLARQFAIVEQAALSEVDWKDLVDMKWSHSSQTTLNWVNYLADQDRKGIDMVVARFNLMVKWALSQIVMTTNRALRASTITKLIHVAVYSRRIRNYATMLQMTIALCSIDCTRLVKTWELVPDGEKQLLKEMERLIQPTRNFHNLRSEMETCNLQEGCIPFVGLYVQDLTYNAQKPAQIAGTRDGEPLVNFERYRTAASIVKSLLRLIDSSTKYNFEPIYGLVERCLWIASLTDDRIITLSKELE
ncbi:low temperature essential protein 1 [Coccidioides immitis RS]|uniref:Low temperature essential protein 1 n=1 Tax=Coccidioides immitis (strain RS) TaxID=246410 RepID=A0A0E1RY87_COCIM|nr:low temperature essential protein 1 [Coccidioides immitis RS]EAS32384.1 low temperature essential protein 1 [Coccidioides immitis RS]